MPGFPTPAPTLSLLCVLLTAGCTHATSLSEYVPASPQEAEVLVLAPLKAIMEGVRTRNVETILAAYADDARIADFTAVFSRPYVISPRTKAVLSKEELRSIYLYEFANRQMTSVNYFNPTIRFWDGEATVTVQAQMIRLPFLGRSRREMYAAEAVFTLRLDPSGWRIVKDSYERLGYNVF